MAFSTMTIVDDGRELFASAIAENETVIFTKIKTTEDVYDGSELETLKDISNVKQEFAVNDIKKTDGGHIIVAANADNTKVTTPYTFRTYGIFAKNSKGDEFLVAVASDPAPIEIPAFSSGQILNFGCSGTFRIENIDVVSIQVDPMNWVTQKQFADHKTQVKDEISVMKSSIFRIPGFSISQNAWGPDMTYIISHEGIKADSICQGMVNNTTIEVYRAANITGETVDGKLILTCRTIPVGAIIYDCIEVRNWGVE